MTIHEISSAFISSAMISPFMTYIDLSLINSQYNKENFYNSFTRIINTYNKRKILKPLFIMNNVYFSTYLSANLTEYYCKKHNIDYKIPTLITTSIVNIYTISIKDKNFSYYFNNKLNFKAYSYLLFGLRDIITIGSCFIIKKDFINFLDKYNNNHNFNDFFASLFIPILAQFFNTPIHILSLDYALNSKSNIYDKIYIINKNYKNVLFGRIIRVIPAFGLGGFLNDMFRSFRYN